MFSATFFMIFERFFRCECEKNNTLKKMSSVYRIVDKLKKKKKEELQKYDFSD